MTGKAKSVLIRPAPLPIDNKELQERAKPLSLNAAVKYSLANGGYEVVKPYVEAVHNVDAVEGSIIMDRASAAIALRKHEKTKGNFIIGNQNLKAIDHSLNVALRWYQIDRKRRKLEAIAHHEAQQKLAQQMLDAPEDRPVTKDGGDEFVNTNS